MNNNPSNTVQNGNGDRRRIWNVESDDLDRVFKRNKENILKNMYKRGQRGEK